MTENPGGRAEENADKDVQLTPQQQRLSQRDARRQAKDDAYDAKLARKRSKDGHFWHGRHVVDARGLAEAFPEPESPEYSTGTVRRRITHGVTLVVLMALVVAGVVLAGMIQRGEIHLHFGFPKAVDLAGTCPADTLNFPENKAVTVNVFNAGSTEGQAGKVAAELKKRGYILGAVSNKATGYNAPAIIVAGKSGLSSALNVQRTVVDADFVYDARKDASVDVVLTDAYKGLADPKKINQKPGALSCPRLSPSPTLSPSLSPASLSPASSPTSSAKAS